VLPCLCCEVAIGVGSTTFLLNAKWRHEANAIKHLSVVGVQNVVIKFVKTVFLCRYSVCICSVCICLISLIFTMSFDLKIATCFELATLRFDTNTCGFF